MVLSYICKNSFLKTKRLFFLYLLPLLAIQWSCTTVDLYEKTVPIPSHKWSSSFKPEFNFTIKDTLSSYQVFLVLRHNEKYNFNNIFVNLHARLPNQDTVLKIRQDLRLANQEGGWEGSGMDDIYEHRVKMGEPQALKPGNYTFILEQIMREDPLEHVMDVGIRIEKK